MSGMKRSAPILLASGSSYRRALLKKLIDDFEVASPDIDERALANESPACLALRLARQKVEALFLTHPNHWIIGSDQVATVGRTRLDKPGNHSEAFRQLQECSGQCVSFHTALCLAGPGQANVQSAVDICKVHFKTLSRRQIERYLEREKPFDCAASLKSEGAGIALIRKIRGDDPNALIGLPLILLTQMFENAGVDLP